MCDTRTCAAMAHVRSFNSKLVRIRSVRGAMNCATTSQEDKGFNSKLVRLEGGNHTRTCAAVAHVRSFNSKLVRLEVKIAFRLT